MDVSAFAREIGQKIRAKRKDSGLTQQELASCAGVSERLVRSVENGEAYGVGLDKLASLLSQLGMALRIDDVPKTPPVVQDPSYSDLLRKTVHSWKDGD